MNCHKKHKKRISIRNNIHITWVWIHSCFHANLILIETILRADETDDVFFWLLFVVLKARKKQHYQIERQNDQNGCQCDGILFDIKVLNTTKQNICSLFGESLATNSNISQIFDYTKLYSARYGLQYAQLTTAI